MAINIMGYNPLIPSLLGIYISSILNPIVNPNTGSRMTKAAKNKEDCVSVGQTCTPIS